jgi:hypothetical protein
MKIINRYSLVILVMVCMIFPSISYEGDYLYLDKQGKVKGWYDRDTNLRSAPSGVSEGLFSGVSLWMFRSESL